MSKIFIEEKGKYQIDLTASIHAIGDLHEKYKCIANYLPDVDFIAELDDAVLLIEYKNSNLAEANDAVFREKLTNGKLGDNIIKKFYSSVFYMLACGQNKPMDLICIIESDVLDSVLRRRLLASIKKRLPYKLQELAEIKITLIRNFKIISIKEWNEQYPLFPLTVVS